jgi:pimeloyl-ACP methyl ester carboxylesterase
MNTRKRWSARRRIGLTLLGLLGVVVLVLVILGLMAVVPPSTSGLASHPNPAASYDEAVQRVNAIQATETTGYNPLCRTQLLTHGQKTARAIAFIHGYTNCPNQFVQLGHQFFDLGYNVLLVPMPYQGLAEVMTTEPSKLTAEVMIAYGDQLVDILHGLGDYTILGGLSQGGVVAAWAAQTRPDLDLAVLMAPGFSVTTFPSPARNLVINLATSLPDVYLWWGSLVRSPFLPPPPKTLTDTTVVQGYPVFSVHGLAQQLRLGMAVQGLAGRMAPAAHSILLVINANDQAVDNTLARQVVADWQAHGANVNTYEYPANLQIDHDMIDPHRDDQHVDRVYPKLIELINNQK